MAGKKRKSSTYGFLVATGPQFLGASKKQQNAIRAAEKVLKKKGGKIPAGVFNALPNKSRTYINKRLKRFDYSRGK